MTLSKREGRVLSALQLRADTPVATIAAELKMQVHALRYAATKLIENGTIRPSHVICISKLGLIQVHFLLSFSVRQNFDMRKIVSFISQAPGVYVFTELSGSYHYELVYCCRQLHAAAEFLREISEKFPGILGYRASAVCLEYTIFRRKHWDPAVRGELTFVGPLSFDVCDELDWSILYNLAAHGDKSFHEIARILDKPTSTVVVRVRKLVERGILCAYVYDVEPLTYGYHDFKILISCHSVPHDFKARLRQFAAEHPQIVFFSEFFGEWDFELDAELADASHIVALTQEIQGRFHTAISKIEVLQRFRGLHLNPFPFARAKDVR